MGNRKGRKKDLQKRLCTIIEIYMDQKGKSKRRQLSDFIEQKMAEIILFSDNLSIKKMPKNKEMLPDEVMFTGN